jgi:hypothetical protein
VTRIYIHWIQWDPELGFSVNTDPDLVPAPTRIFDDKNGLNFVVEKEVCLTIVIFLYHTYVSFLIRIRICNYLSWSGSFHSINKQKTCYLWRLFGKVISKIILVQKLTGTFCWHLESHSRKSRIRIRNTVIQIRGSGSVSKRHGSGTLVSSNLMPSWAMQN